MSASGNEAVVTLASARKIVQLYPAQHSAYTHAIDALVRAVCERTAGGTFALNLHQGRLYDGSDVIDPELPGAGALASAIESRSIESLVFVTGFDKTDAQGLLEAFDRDHGAGEAFSDALAKLGVRNVAVAMIERSDDDERDRQRETQRQKDRALYNRLSSSFRTVTSQIGNGASVDLSESTELVEGLLGRLMEDKAAVLGLATIRGAGEEALHHSLNVMIYTSVLGNHLGLPESDLVVLGTAALFHDIGKSVDAGDPDTSPEERYQNHPEAGAHVLQQLALSDPVPMLVAYEHHMHMDNTGFPDRPADYVSHPYSRMVSVADRFENLTTTGDTGEGLTPDRAMVRLFEEAPGVYDPFFVRLFAGAMGAFPVGCVVRLSDHSVGIVCEPGTDPLSPVVKLIFDTQGREVERPGDIDLAATDLRLVEVIGPDVLGIEVARRL